MTVEVQDSSPGLSDHADTIAAIGVGVNATRGSSGIQAARSPRLRVTASRQNAVFFAQLRAWSEAHPYAGPVVRSAEELRRLAAGESVLALKNKPPPKG
jgi:hypothetical protein